ncbi:MAG: hypothetical protein HY921_01770 [Elusimicrobia bacterium]|nr:hypothetical protein [Elusimicrobiota bacterium]
MRGLRLLITSGPTREFLDPIRFMTNASSGRMGWALARQAIKRGARVTVVSGPSCVPAPKGVEVVRVLTGLDMLREVLARLPGADLVIGAAAVSDWRFAARRAHKIKRGPEPLRLTLIPNPDIIKAVAGRKSSQGRPIVVGFALQTRAGLEAAREKMRRKGLDLVVFNGPSSLGGDRSKASILRRDGWVRSLPEQSKDALARAILAAAEVLL